MCVVLVKPGPWELKPLRAAVNPFRPEGAGQRAAATYQSVHYSCYCSLRMWNLCVRAVDCSQSKLSAPDSSGSRAAGATELLFLG